MPRTTARRTAVSLASTLVVGALSLAALTGCAPPSHPSATLTNHPVAHPTSPSASNPTALTTPGGVSCEDLATTAHVQAALESPAVVPEPYSDIEGGGPPELYDLVVPLAGGVDCLWQDSVTDPTITLTVNVLPNASAAFAAASPDLEAADDGHNGSGVIGVPVYGDASWTQCSNIDDPWYGECNFNIKVGNYWIAVDQDNPNFVAPYPETAADLTLLQGIVSAVRRLPASPAIWHPVAESFTLPTSCTEVLPVARLRTATEEPGLVAGTETDPGADLDTLNGAASRATHQLQCFWSAPDNASVTFNLIPGSAALTTREDFPGATARAGYSPVAGLGDSAYQKCENTAPANNCQALILVGHSWFEFSVVKPLAIDPTAFDALARQILTAMGFHS